MSPERNSQRCWWVPNRTLTKVTQYEECVSDDDLVTMGGKRLHPENFPWDDNVGWINHIFEHETNDELPYTSFEEAQKVVWSYPAFTYLKHEKGLLRPDGQPGFNTPSGRIELYHTNLMLWGYDPLPDFKAVSYTHLDVYKRQDLRHSAHEHHAGRDGHPDVVHDEERLEQPVAREIAGEGEQRGNEEHQEPERQQMRVHEPEHGLPGEAGELRELAEEHAGGRAGNEVDEGGVDEALHMFPFE